MGRILVVGATGLIGAPVTRRLVADGHQVRLLVRDTGGPGRCSATVSNMWKARSPTARPWAAPWQGWTACISVSAWKTRSC